MDIILQDTNIFFNNLLLYYNIQMFLKKELKHRYEYLGDAFSSKGEHYMLSVVVEPDKTMIQVFNVTGRNRVCVFQKSYSTKSDNHALSKSVSVVNFLNKVLVGV